MAQQESGSTQAIFRRILLRSIALPLILMIALAIILVWQVGRLIQSARFVEQTDGIIADSNALQTLHLDLETGVRGYLITDDPDFLQPYDSAITRVVPLSNKIASEIKTSPSQQDLLQEIDNLRNQWLEYASIVLEARRKNGNWHTLVLDKHGKSLMDSIRSTFANFISNEDQLRRAQSEDARTSALAGLYFAGGLAIVVGVLISLLSKRQIETLGKNYELALATAAELSAGLEQRVQERTQELAQSNSALEEANRELEAFSYSISHDLRAPLRHIEGFADLLRMNLGKSIEPDASENLETINSTAQLAGRMVDDVLRLSRISRTQLSYSLVDMNSLVEECVREIKLDTTGREIRWTIGDLPPVEGDRSLLKLVVQNLISNAVKYSSNVKVAEIEIAAHTNEGEITYWVRDNGAGFNMDYAHKLFGVFQRLHRAEDFEGTGIGLANVRRIVLRHGGRVWAEGKVDHGATFYFAIPIHQAGK